MLDLSLTPALDYARDMFMMSFYLRGMSLDCNTNYSGYMLEVMIDVVAGVAIGASLVGAVIAYHRQQIVATSLRTAIRSGTSTPVSIKP